MSIRIHLSQLNTRVGDIEGNLALALASWEKARLAKADLIVYPEQTLPGYPAKDMLLFPAFIERNRAALERFAEATADGPASLIGFPEPHAGTGSRLYNSAALCRGGRVEAIYRKWLLPTYDVFDEDRYFDEGSDSLVVELAGHRVGITICEDIWNDELYWSHRRYERNPIAAAKAAGAEVLINLSASPFTLGKRRVRKQMIAHAAVTYELPIIHVNLVGANDDVVFDGVSLAYDRRGECLAQLASFDADEATVEPFAGSVVAAKDEPEIEQLRRALALGIRDYIRKCGFRQVLIGLSGGIDSALVAALAVDALGSENVIGVGMPSRYSSDHSKSDAEDLARALGIQFRMIPIEGMFGRALEELEPHFGSGNRRIATENMQSRLRGLTLMTLSNESGALVLTTGNKSELSVGYCTLYGDMCGGLAVIGDLPKLKVYELSNYINERAGRIIIPESTLTKAPSAELAPNQKDSDSLPPYEILDPIVLAYVEEGLDAEAIIARGYDEATVRRVLRLITLNEYKRRQAAPTLKVTGRAFGYGWRMPIARAL